MNQFERDAFRLFLYRAISSRRIRQQIFVEIEPKVFGVGFHKTGTTTLEAMLEKLGYYVNPAIEGYNTMEEFSKGNFKPVMELAKKYNALSDSPWCYPGVYNKMDKEYPSAKFILTTRESENWFDSLYRNYLRLCEVVEEKKVEEENFDEKDWWDKWATGIHYKKLYGFVPTHPAELLREKENIINVYNKYNKDVQNYFSGRRNKLLVVDWQSGSGWREVCSFLNKKRVHGQIPWKLRTK